MYKKCVFPKMGTKRFPRHRKKSRILTIKERHRKLKEWNNGW